MEARPKDYVPPTDAGPAVATDPVTSAHNGHGPSPGDALRQGISHLGEVFEYLSHFVAAKVDGVKVSLRNVMVYAVLGVLGLIVGGAILATTGVLLMVGIAHGLGALFGGRDWLGELVLGVVVLGGMAAAVVVGLKWFTKTSRKNLLSKYEERLRRQRSEYGHDVAAQATAAAREHAAGGHS